MLTGPAQTAAAQDRLSLPALKAGATEVTGFVDPPAGGVRRVVIEVRREAPPGSAASPCTASAGIVVDRTVATTIDAETGRFTAKLSAGLAAGDCLIGTGTNTAGAVVTTLNAPRVAATEPPAAVKPPEIRVPLRAGSRVVSGWIPAGKDLKIDKVVITVRRSRDERHAAERSTREGDAPGAVVRAQTAEIGADGGFNVALPQPIIDGQDVEVAVFAGAARLSSATAVVEDPGDWGRVRAYFAGGVIVSQSREEFSKQDFLLALVLDNAWYQPTPPQLILPEQDRECTREAWIAVKTDGAAASGAPRPETAAPVDQARRRELLATFDVDQLSASDSKLTKNYRRLLPKTDPCWRSKMSPRIQLNSFLDVRMTALPVKAQAADTSMPSSSARTEAAAVSGKEFVDARKAALIHFGFYVPFYGRTTMWNFQGHRNALFVAPVVRGGIQTISEEDSALALSGEDGDNVYSFISYGIGIGHYKLSATKDRAPELISYLHITRGAFENFRRAGDAPRFRPQRWAIEGRMKIPETPMQVGLDANLGNGPDSVAITFATRFDIGELFGKLQTFKP
jgi:hypothetical protein